MISNRDFGSLDNWSWANFCERWEIRELRSSPLGEPVTDEDEAAEEVEEHEEQEEEEQEAEEQEEEEHEEEELERVVEAAKAEINFILAAASFTNLLCSSLNAFVL